MNTGLDGVNVAVIGGDRRQLAVMAALQKEGARISYFGFPDWPELAGAKPACSLEDALAEARVILLPINGTDPNGKVRTVDGVPPIVLTEDSLLKAPPQALLVIGSLRPMVRLWAEHAGLDVLEYAEEDQIAILNSIPTGEGAIQLAMNEMPITVHGSRSFVLGFGRCAVTLARMLHALGARTTVYARRPAQIARAVEMGLEGRKLEDLSDDIADADVIYNSIPALVLPETLLQKTHPSVLIIDIASAPGGVDFDAAARLGRRAILALGLPGRVAPQTAGEILASALPGLIKEALASR